MQDHSPSSHAGSYGMWFHHYESIQKTSNNRHDCLQLKALQYSQKENKNLTKCIYLETGSNRGKL